MRAKSACIKTESTRGRRALTPVAFCMRSAEQGNRSDIFAAAECGVMGSGEYLEPREFRGASSITKQHAPIVLVTKRIGLLVLSAPIDLGVNFSESGIGHVLQ